MHRVKNACQPKAPRTYNDIRDCLAQFPDYANFFKGTFPLTCKWKVDSCINRRSFRDRARIGGGHVHKQPSPTDVDVRQRDSREVHPQRDPYGWIVLLCTKVKETINIVINILKELFFPDSAHSTTRFSSPCQRPMVQWFWVLFFS